LEEDVLQDIMSEVFVPQQVRGQAKEQGAIPGDEDLERAVITELRLLDKDSIRKL